MANDEVIRAVVLACTLYAAVTAAVPVSDLVECRDAIQDIYAKFKEMSLNKPGLVGLDMETKAKAKYIMKNLCRLVGGCGGAVDTDICGAKVVADKDTGAMTVEKESADRVTIATGGDGCGLQPHSQQQPQQLRIDTTISTKPVGDSRVTPPPMVVFSRSTGIDDGDGGSHSEAKTNDADTSLLPSHVRMIELAMDAVQKILMEYIQSNCNVRSMSSDKLTTGRPAFVVAGEMTAMTRRRDDNDDRDKDRGIMKDVLRKMNLPPGWGGIAPTVSATFASGTGQHSKNDVIAAMSLTSSSSSSSSSSPVPKSSGILSFSMFNRRTAAATPSPAKPHDSSTPV